MGDETTNSMNLDLNLGPLPEPEMEQGSEAMYNGSVNFDDWIDGVNRLRETFALRTRQRWRSVWQQVPVPPETRSIALEFMVNPSTDDGGSLQPGEGSVTPEERNAEILKVGENNVVNVENEELGKNENEEMGNGDTGTFFDCNICLDLARNPVVTCCGHLFCWSCLYQWLHLHSDTKECPVCKGEVTIKSVTPIYGRGNNTREMEGDTSLKIPIRPQARRIESWRQSIQRNLFAIPMEEMIRRLGSRFDLTRDLVQVQEQHTETESAHDLTPRWFLNRLMSSRIIRREHSTGDDVVAQSAASVSNLTSTLSSAETLIDSYFQNHPVERNQQQPSPVDDRDSVSSIAAVIHSDSQTVDTAVEIDSTVFLSTSSSRRRNDASRVSDVDSGDSRAHRRRRLN